MNKISKYILEYILIASSLILIHLILNGDLNMNISSYNIVTKTSNDLKTQQIENLITTSSSNNSLNNDEITKICGGDKSCKCSIEASFRVLSNNEYNRMIELYKKKDKKSIQRLLENSIENKGDLYYSTFNGCYNDKLVY